MGEWIIKIISRSSWLFNILNKFLCNGVVVIIKYPLKGQWMVGKGRTKEVTVCDISVLYVECKSPIGGETCEGEKLRQSFNTPNG